MRILFVVPEMTPRAGGPAAFAQAISSAMIEQGHEVTVAAHFPSNRLELSPYCNVLSLSSPRGRYGRVMGLSVALRPVISASDIVVVHGLWQHVPRAAAREAQRASVPYIVIPHGMLDPLIVHRTRLHRVIRRLQLLAHVRRDLAAAQHVVFTTPAEQRKAAAVVTTAHGRLIRYGTVDPHLTPRDVSETAVPVQIGYLGRLHPKKNLEALIEAVALLQKPTAVHLTIVGPHSDYGVRLSKRVEQLGIGNCVTIAGEIGGELMFRTLRQWDWLALVSHQENFGQVASQALSVGTPVILSDALDIAATVADGGAALITPTDPRSISQILDRAIRLRQSSEYVRFRQAARHLYEAQFFFNNTAEDISRMLAGPAPHR